MNSLKVLDVVSSCFIDDTAPSDGELEEINNYVLNSLLQHCRIEELVLLESHVKDDSYLDDVIPYFMVAFNRNSFPNDIHGYKKLKMVLILEALMDNSLKH